MRKKSFFRGVLSVFLAVILGFLTPVSTYALSEAQLNMFSQNNILFYDPSGGGCHSSNLAGNNVMTKVVDYLKGNNPTGFVLSDNGIAGVLANFQGESGFNPFRFEGDSTAGPGYGIAQFTPMSNITDVLKSDSKTSNYFNEYFDIKYTHYDVDTGFPKEQVPDAVLDAWLTVQLDYFFGPSSEFENTRVGGYRNLGGTMGLDYISDDMTVHEAMDEAKTAEDATRIFVWIMERPGNKEGAAGGRSQNAQKWLGLAESISSNGVASGSSTNSDGSNVTIIGDSITVGSEGKIRELLPNADIRAQVNKQFYNGSSDNPGGITILKELVDSNELRDVLVYALGTNSSGTTEAQAKEVVDLAGGSRKVVFVTNYTTANDYIGNNNVFRKIANENSNVSIADWKGAIESKSAQYLGGDGIHPNAEGQELFANIIASTVNGADNSVSSCTKGSVNGGLTDEQAQKIADYYNGPNVDGSVLPYGKMNCVSFSMWFVQYFTGLGWGGGDGGYVAHNLAVANGLEEGNEPRPFALFSTTDAGLAPPINGVLYGHTGIVVAVNGNDLTTVEAAYAIHDGRVYHRDISQFTNIYYNYTFTYLDSLIDQSKLADIAEN